jgi:4-oxalocrotonate tautomerase
MPLVSVEVIENVFTPEQKKQMIKKLTDAMVSIEGEALRDYTLVKIEEIKEGNWSVGGRTLDASDVRRLQLAKAS